MRKENIVSPHVFINTISMVFIYPCGKKLDMHCINAHISWILWVLFMLKGRDPAFFSQKWINSNILTFFLFKGIPLCRPVKPKKKKSSNERFFDDEDEPSEPVKVSAISMKCLQGGQHFNFSKFPDFSLTFLENFLWLWSLRANLKCNNRHSQ